MIINNLRLSEITILVVANVNTLFKTTHCLFYYFAVRSQMSATKCFSEPLANPAQIPNFAPSKTQPIN
jgi:hypothetical protein